MYVSIVSSGLSGITISGDKKQSRGGKAIKKAKKVLVYNYSMRHKIHLVD